MLREHELELQAYGAHATIDEYEDGVLVDKKNLFRETPLRPEPSIQHIKQLEYYLVVLESNDRPVSRAVFLYIPWFNLVLGPIEVDVTSRLRPMETIKAELITKVTALRELPKPTVGDHCGFCPYFNRCFAPE